MPTEARSSSWKTAGGGTETNLALMTLEALASNEYFCEYEALTEAAKKPTFTPAEPPIEKAFDWLKLKATRASMVASVTW